MSKINFGLNFVVLLSIVIISGCASHSAFRGGDIKLYGYPDSAIDKALKTKFSSYRLVEVVESVRPSDEGDVYKRAQVLGVSVVLKASNVYGGYATGGYTLNSDRGGD